MIVESLFHYQLVVDIYCYSYYIFIVFNITLVLVISTKGKYFLTEMRNVENIKSNIGKTISNVRHNYWTFKIDEL